MPRRRRPPRGRTISSISCRTSSGSTRWASSIPGCRRRLLDQLSREGVRFDRTYVAQALCTPSRASIFSGLYPHAHKLQENVYGIDNVLVDPKYNLSVVWPGLLQAAGYHTSYIGKWHLGEKGPTCFDEWHGFNSTLSHWLGKPQQSKYRPDRDADDAHRVP